MGINFFLFFNLFSLFLNAANTVSQTLPNNFLAMLADRFAPEIRLHEREEYPFTSVESYLEQVGLGIFRHGRFDIILKPGKVSIGRLNELYFDHKSRLEPAMRKTNEGFIGDLCFFLPSDRQLTLQGQVEPVCYAYPRYVPELKVIDISYIFFHPFNGEVYSHHACLSWIY